MNRKESFIRHIVKDFSGIFQMQGYKIDQNASKILGIFLVAIRDFKDELKDIQIDGNNKSSFSQLLSEKIDSRYGKDIFGKEEFDGMSPMLFNLFEYFFHDRSVFENTNSTIYYDIYNEFLNEALVRDSGLLLTPSNIISLMVLIVDPKNQDKLCDLNCGTGSFLVEATKNVSKSPLLLKGIERSTLLSELAKIRMILAGLDPTVIENSDFLYNDLKSVFDVILLNPSFSQRLNVNQYSHKLVNTNKSELLFLDSAIEMLKDDGRAAIIVPLNALFATSAAHLFMRRKLVDNQYLKAVITLPANVFVNANVNSAILIIDKSRFFSEENKKVWFGSIEDIYSKKSKKWDSRINLSKFLTDYYEKADDKLTNHFFLSFDEIKDNGYSLSTQDYKEIPYRKIEFLDPKTLINELKENRKIFNEKLAELEAYMDEKE